MMTVQSARAATLPSPRRLQNAIPVAARCARPMGYGFCSTDDVVALWASMAAAAAQHARAQRTRGAAMSRTGNGNAPDTSPASTHPVNRTQLPLSMAG
jgi:hypothetical protein